MSELEKLVAHLHADTEQDKIENILIEIFGLCGCSEYTEACNVLSEALTEIAVRDRPDGDYQMAAVMRVLRTHSEGAYYMFMAQLDKADLTEHGTAVRWSWLTPKGEEMLTLVKRYLELS